MQKGIIGKKIGMTQIFDENGKVVPVTVVAAGRCTVVQKKTVESDGYVAVQLGFGDISAKKVTKPAKGHFDKADVAPKMPAQSSAGTAIAFARATVPALWHVMPVLWVPARRRPACSRAKSCPVTSVQSASQYRT